MKNRLFRTYEIKSGDINEEERTILLSFSSEEPYMRSFGIEILDHDEKSVKLDRLNNGAPLLFQHDMDKQIGVVEKAYIGEGRRGEALVRFSRSQFADEIFRDVLDGIRRNVSVGYEVNQMKQDGEMEGTKVYRVTDWVPLEVSSVSIPADNTVGFGRSLEKDFDIKNYEEEKQEPMEEKEVKVPEVPVVDVKAERDAARKEEQARIREIMAIADGFNLKDKGREYVESGKSVDEFRKVVMEDLKMKEVKINEKADIGMTDKEIKGYSLVRAIRGMASGNLKREAPFEAECSEAVAKRLGKDPQGVFIPDDVLYRDLTVGTPTSPSTGGGNLVATNLLASSFIELLRNKMVVKEMGARVLDGLQGDVLIPKQSGGATSYWVSENTAITAESDQTFTQLSMRPKTLGAYTDISRKLLIQSSLDVEALIRNDLATTLALAIDKAALMGSGAPSSIPTGILSYSGIGSVDCAGIAPDYADIIELWSDVAVENADFGSLGFVCNAKMAAKMLQIFPNTTGGDTPVWQGGPGDGTMLGFKARVTNQIPSTFTSAGATTGGALTAIIFGNWADLVLGFWSGVDVLVDPYTGGTAGTVRVITLQDLDVQIRHAQSFSATKNAAS